MERIQPMNELQIQEKVEDLAGKSARILDCEQNTLNQTEEVLLVNGVKISLAGDEGARIKKALIDGEVPPCDLVNNMLIRAGIEKNPVELETTVNVKSSTKTLEHSQLRNSSGVLVDEKMREKEDEDEYRQVNVEIWNSASSPQMEGGAKNNLTQGKGRSPSPGDKATKAKKSIFSPLIKKPAKSQNQQQPPQEQQQKQQLPNTVKDNKKTANSRQQDQQQHKHTSDVQKHQTSLEEQPQEPQQKGGQKPNNGNNNKIWSFFLKGKSSKDSSRPEGDRSSSDKTAFGIISCPDDKKKKNKSKTKSQPHQEPNYDNIVRNSAAAMSSHPKFKSKQSGMIDPSVSLINVEIDGIPARVTYETFV